MQADEKSHSKIVSEGFERACKDFTALVEPLGFKRTKKRFWSRPGAGLVEVIHFHRSGSSYGAAINNSVHIRVHFAVHPPGSTEPLALNGPSSESLRSSRGYGYHTRFNALTGSTYERCIADLLLVTTEHGLPWFKQQRA